MIHGLLSCTRGCLPVFTSGQEAPPPPPPSRIASQPMWQRRTGSRTTNQSASLSDDLQRELQRVTWRRSEVWCEPPAARKHLRTIWRRGLINEWIHPYNRTAGNERLAKTSHSATRSKVFQKIRVRETHFAALEPLRVAPSCCPPDNAPAPFSERNDDTKSTEAKNIDCEAGALGCPPSRVPVASGMTLC